MSILEFPLFGPVSPGEEYDTTAPFKGQQIPVRLNLRQIESFEDNQEVITATLAFIAHWEKHLTTALTAIDGNPQVAEYLEHHLTEFDQEALSQILHEVLREGEQPTVEKLATTLVLTAIRAVPAPEATEIGSIDFSLGNSDTQYVLKAVFDITGDFTGFQMDS